MSSQPPKLRPIRGGRLTVHEPEQEPQGTVRLLILPGDQGDAHTILEAKSFQPVALAKAISITVPAEALDSIEKGKPTD